MSPPSFFADVGNVATPPPVPAHNVDLKDRADVEYPFFLAHARQIEGEHPEHLAALGMTAEEYARSMSGPSLTIEESVAAGWMSAAEGRFIQGRATRDDLLELGHPPDEAQAILAAAGGRSPGAGAARGRAPARRVPGTDLVLTYSILPLMIEVRSIHPAW